MTAAIDYQAGPPKRALVLVKPMVASPAPPPPPPSPPFPPPPPAGPAVAIDRWRARLRSGGTGNTACRAFAFVGDVADQAA
jgi:hypothetical protein